MVTSFSSSRSPLSMKFTAQSIWSMLSSGMGTMARIAEINSPIRSCGTSARKASSRSSRSPPPTWLTGPTIILRPPEFTTPK